LRLLLGPQLISLWSRCAGPLLLAFLEYLILPSTQADLSVENFEPLPEDVINYIRTKALPLVITDPKFPRVGAPSKVAMV